MTTRRQPVHRPELLGLECPRCSYPIGDEPRPNGDVAALVTVFFRPDGSTSAKCPRCRDIVALPYRRVA